MSATDRCRHRTPPCARCRRAARLRELLRFIRGAELAAGCHLPIAAADLDPGVAPPSRHRRPRRRRAVNAPPTRQRAKKP